MIKLNEKYNLDTDAFSFVIKELKTNKKGQKMFMPIAWCGNLKQLKSYLLEKEIRENHTILENIDKCIELSQHIDTLIGESNVKDY